MVPEKIPSAALAEAIAIEYRDGEDYAEISSNVPRQRIKANTFYSKWDNIRE